MHLEAVPGVGAKTAERLRELDDPEGALERGDVAAVARAPGIGEARAARVVRAAIRHCHDDSGGFLATPQAESIYETLLDELRERAVTEYAAHRLATFYPTGEASRIEEVCAFAERALDRDPDPAVRAALADVEPLDAPDDVRVRDRCVATGDAEAYARARDALPEVSVELVEDATTIADLARGYATVVVLDEAFAGREFEGDVRVEPDALDAPERVVPERALAFFAANRDRLRAAAAVHRAAGMAPPDDLDLPELDAALDRLDDDGGVAGDEELDRLTRAAADLDAAASTAESVANDRLREAIRERDVTIEGADLLSLVEQGAGADAVFSRELADEHADAVDAARDHLIDALDLDGREAELARAAFGDGPTFPVERDQDAVGRLRTALETARDRRATRLKRDLAADLAGLREGCERLVRAALERDVELALARFARDYDCTIPERGGRGFDIEGGRSPLLDVAREDVEPVDYTVDGVALLSGVNSGGKTATLDLVAAVTILAHAGLPVPADSARVPAVDELHYHAKTQGTLDAGAFEATLRDFAGIAGGGDGEDDPADAARKLVLVDELESITEPGASAVIVAGVLEALDAGDATAVVVSHLAGEISDACEFDVTVDGIRALGLVDGELRVDRSPEKGHLARSTPELIVEKLAEGTGAPFYRRLLGKFAAAERDTPDPDTSEPDVTGHGEPEPDAAGHDSPT